MKNFLISLLFIPSILFAGTNYYVSPSGNDANQGISPNNPWRTVEKVNSTTLVAGDKVFFEGGQTWTGNLLIVNSGNELNPIIVSTYGSGKATIFGGDSTCIKLLDCEFISVSNFILRGSGIDTTLGFTTSRGCGVLAQSTALSGERLKGITIQNNIISGVRTGILISASSGVFPQLSWRGYENVKVIQNDISNCGVSGIYFWAEPFGALTNSWGHAFEAGETSAYPWIVWHTDESRRVHKDIHVANNHVHDNYGFKSGSYFQSRSGAGIRINNVWKGLVENNLVNNCGNMKGDTASYQQPANIEAEGTIGITYRYNESSNCHIGTATFDAAGMDVFDAANHDVIVEYNYVHNNDGYGFGMGGSESGGGKSYNVTIRYNLSINNAVKNFAHLWVSGPTIDLNVYNNLFYDDLPGGRKLLASTNESNGIVSNNIFYSKHGRSPFWMSYYPWPTLLGNLYYSNAGTPLYDNTVDLLTFLRSSRGGEHYNGQNFGTVADPQFINPGNTPNQLPNNPVTLLSDYNYNGNFPAFDIQSLINGNIPNIDFNQNAFNLVNMRIGPHQQSINSLPLSFMSFQSICNGANSLKWTTTQEINVKHFIIEKSENGIQWNKIGTLPVGGNNYSFKDKGNGFYRIAAVDHDGKKTYSKTLKSSCFDETKKHFKTYPTITRDVINLSFQAVIDGKTTIKIINASGNVVKQIGTWQYRGNTQVSLDISYLPAAVYYLEYDGITSKIIKQ